jgi:hypothetical protein
LNPRRAAADRLISDLGHQIDRSAPASRLWASAFANVFAFGIELLEGAGLGKAEGNDGRGHGPHVCCRSPRPKDLPDKSEGLYAAAEGAKFRWWMLWGLGSRDEDGSEGGRVWAWFGQEENSRRAEDEGAERWFERRDRAEEQMGISAQKAWAVGLWE